MEKAAVFALLYVVLSRVNADIITFEGGMSELLSFENTLALRQQLHMHLRNFYHSSPLQKMLDAKSGEEPSSKLKISPACSKAIAFASHNTTAWSTIMLDAMAKPPTSIKYLANHWAGGFEECNENQPPKVYPGNEKGPATYYARIAIFANIDPVTLPKGVLLDYGACVPDTCTEYDVYLIGLALLYFGSKEIPLLSKLAIVGVEKLPKTALPLSSAAIAMISLTSIFGFIMLLATIYDVVVVHKVLEKLKPRPVSVDEEEDENFVNHIPNGDITAEDQQLIVAAATSRDEPPVLKMWQKLIIAFSVYTNSRKMFDTQQQSGRLNCLDGIRFLSMSWVMLGHCFFFGIYVCNNLGYQYPLIFKHWTYAAIYNATFSVDTFFVLSGLLTTYMFLKETARSGISRIRLWLLFFLHRYWRLTPPYMLFLGFYTALFVYFSGGPFWSYTNGLDQSNCAKTWWYNLLYINNLISGTEGCMGWTWYLANDMQFHYIVAPVILVFMYLFGIYGIVSTVPVLLGSMIATGVIAYKDKTATIMDANENVYFKPWCRVSSYLVGMGVGLLIHEFQRRNKRLHWGVVLVGWMSSTAACLVVLYGVAGVVSGASTVSKGVAALYTATSRFTWSLGVAWVIFACVTGYGGVVNSFLSWRAFIPLSRLTYSAYLVHPVVIVAIYFSNRIAPFATAFTIVTWFGGVMMVTYLVAFLLSITWESPLLGIERVLLKRQ